jgi:hypothetical protein
VKAHLQNPIQAAVGAPFKCGGIVTTNTIVELNKGPATPISDFLPSKKHQSFFNGFFFQYAETFINITPPSLMESKSLVYFGDVVNRTFRYPTLIRSRPVHQSHRTRNHIMLPFLFERRYLKGVDDVKTTDVPFHNKRNVLVWRGAPSGYPCFHLNVGERWKPGSTYPNRSRLLFLEKYSNIGVGSIDVGIHSEEPIHCRVPGVNTTKYAKPRLTWSDVLSAKMVMVIEGDDDATSVYWALASNSVPFMNQPLYESWVLQSRLVPWKHYVPVADDFSDVIERMKWVIDNQDKAKWIAQQGKQYLQEFEDRAREERIATAVLSIYMNKVQIENSSEADSDYQPKVCEYQ